jgi:hypothetical protein
LVKALWNTPGSGDQSTPENSQTPDAMGESIFAKEENPEQILLPIVCHELTHACSSHLDLPTWLNEGLAMVSVDR